MKITAKRKSKNTESGQIMSNDPSKNAVTVAPQQPPTDPDEIDLNNPPFALTAIDRSLLAMRDEDFHRITWADLEEIIGA